MTVVMTNEELTEAVGAISEALNSKADNDLLNLDSTGQKVLDGQWVCTTYQFATGETAPVSEGITYNLSEYLPNDNYIYEVMLTGTGTTGSTSGNQQRIQVSSQVFPYSVVVWSINTRTASGMLAGGSCTLPIGTNRELYVDTYSNNTGTFNLILRGYRRIGTNS